MSDARGLEVHEQARTHGGDGTAEVLMELFVPADQGMATKAGLAEAVSSMNEYPLRMLLLTLIPDSLGVTGPHLAG